VNLRRKRLSPFPLTVRNEESLQGRVFAMKSFIRASVAVLVMALMRPAVLVAQSGSCVSDTTEDAKLYRDGYGGMVSRTDSQSVAGRTILGLPMLPASAVTIVTDSTTCATASAAYDTTLGVSAASEAPIVLKLGNQWIVIKKLDFPGVSPNVLFNLDFTVAQATIAF